MLIMIIIFPIKVSTRNAISKKSILGCYCFLFEKILKRIAQCPVFAQSPPGRQPYDKCPVNTSHRSKLV
jgi:hypothetical protein